MFLISCSSLGKSGKFVCWRPLLEGWRPLLRRILDSPLTCVQQNPSDLLVASSTDWAMTGWLILSFCSCFTLSCLAVYHATFFTDQCPFPMCNFYYFLIKWKICSKLDSCTAEICECSGKTPMYVTKGNKWIIIFFIIYLKIWSEIHWTKKCLMSLPHNRFYFSTLHDK